MSIENVKSILSDLIAFPTVSSESNLALIEYTGAVLERAGARVSIMKSDCQTKANLFATLGPERDGGIVLSGHSDVVPVEGQDWSLEPFQMTERDGRLYGRGTCDMKGFIACCLSFAGDLNAANLTRPLHFAFTYDEEVGCFGAKALVKDLSDRGIRPSVAIIGEPTMMRVIEGHKGCYEYTTHFHGLEGHGSQPERGVNAIEYAVRYIARLMELGKALKSRVQEESRFDPPWSTVQVGRIYGGAGRNIIAGNCCVEWEMRPVCKSDAELVKSDIREYADEVLVPAMRELYPDASIVTETIGEVEGLSVATESEARDIAFELTGANGADVVAFGTEAGLFQEFGMSAVICGPGSIEQAHKTDEFLSVEQLNACIKMLTGLRTKLL
ncbi:acetylornithine deacetylase [Sinorhizobium meliloti]|uniref:acetylornithine deacetylase n=1 Tax=Rhizobium meliloti TaxID=382 RepID=UPI0020912B32|nr:acetylornithine deacetylase [Sinorhizobium meliloti]MCO5965435.1 acetylornithine deacetylase [Sinorhizobium meliloti]